MIHVHYACQVSCEQPTGSCYEAEHCAIVEASHPGEFPRKLECVDKHANPC
jgi:hypothetical protein